jgi:RNA polymerase sigma factor for flagellar operon FliA
VALDAYQELLTRVGEMSLFSLEDLGFGSGEERCNLERRADEGTPDPLGALLSQERVNLVSEAIARLPEREKLVVTLYYHEDMTMKEVGGVLGLTESRVSQLHSQAMLRLKGYLRRHFGRPAPEAT